MVIDGQAEVLDKIKSAWQWWLEELSVLLPDRLLNFFSAGAALLRVEIGETLTCFSLVAAAGDKRVGEIDLLNSSTQQLAQFRRSMVMDRTDSHRVDVILPEMEILTENFYLPLAVEKNLQTALAFELDKLTPFKKQDALFGFRILNSYPEHGKLSVVLHAVSRARVEPYLKKLDTLGLSLSGIYPSGYGKEDLPLTMNMLPPAERAEAEPFWNQEVRRSFLLVLALVFAVLLLPAWYLEHRTDSLQQEIDELRDEATRVAEKRGSVMNYLLARESIAARKTETPGKLELLQEVTQRLPNNTWVSQMRIDGEKASLRGESGKSSDLIELLEKSTRFQNARFSSSVTRSSRSTKELYQIEMDLVGGGT